MKSDTKDQSSIDNLIEKLGEFPLSMGITEFGINLKYRNGQTVGVGNVVDTLKTLASEFHDKMKIVDFDIRIKDVAGIPYRIQTTK